MEVDIIAAEEIIREREGRGIEVSKFEDEIGRRLRGTRGTGNKDMGVVTVDGGTREVQSARAVGLDE